ncbi:MAG: Lycopene beta-cyclase [Bacteroidota bacterium]|jgi:lycopene beta-cyclase
MKNTGNKNYFDFIIAGGGLAGLSLAYYLSKSTLQKLNVLIIDSSAKNSNDKTWCYWSDQEDDFSKICEKEWSKIGIQGRGTELQVEEITPYKYRKIKSEDWYKFVKNQLKGFPNFQFLQADIESIHYAGIGTMVETSKGKFLATQKLFDSISPFPYDKEDPEQLKQHFVGWYIESNFPAFKSDIAHLFDFRLAKGMDAEFIYFLPTNSHTALVEHTFFSGELKDKSYYEEKIKNYLLANFNLGDDDYRILEVEEGIIPMKEVTIAQTLHQKWIKIGTSGGFVKSSTGYSFYQTQKITQNLVRNLENKDFDQEVNPKPKFKKWLDATFLEVMEDPTVDSNEILLQLFEKTEPSLLMKFLQGETTLGEDLSVMTKVPKFIFMRAGFPAFFNILKKN